MLFSVISKDDKNGNFLRRDKSFGMLKRNKSRQSQNKWCNVKVSFTSYQDIIKGEKGHFYKCNIEINQPVLKIQELYIFRE